MKTSLHISALCALALFSTTGCVIGGGARDTPHYFSVQEALNSPEAREVLDPGIRVQFNGGSGKVIRAGLVSNKKTNSFNKTDAEACRWAFLSAVKQFQDSARKYGAKKVINLISYYKKVPYRNSKMYECHAGTAVTGVALKGDLAR